MSFVPLALVARVKRCFCVPRRALLTSGGLGARGNSEFARRPAVSPPYAAFISGSFVGGTPKDAVPEDRNLEGGTASGDGVRRCHSGFGVDYPNQEKGVVTV
jgi:hypothetical protein